VLSKEIELLKSKKIVDLQKKICDKEEFAEKLADEIVLVEKQKMINADIAILCNKYQRLH
jgi:hypothetical protein